MQLAVAPVKNKRDRSPRGAAKNACIIDATRTARSSITPTLVCTRASLLLCSVPVSNALSPIGAAPRHVAHSRNYTRQHVRVGDGRICVYVGVPVAATRVYPPSCRPFRSGHNAPGLLCDGQVPRVRYVSPRQAKPVKALRDLQQVRMLLRGMLVIRTGRVLVLLFNFICA